MRRTSSVARSGNPFPPLWPPRRVLVTVASLAAAIGMVRAGLLEPLVGGGAH